MTSPERPAPIEASIHTAADTVARAAFMVPLLPCGDIDIMADFWTGLGVEVTYRQRRPNPFLALELGGIALHRTASPRRRGRSSRVQPVRP